MTFAKPERSGRSVPSQWSEKISDPRSATATSEARKTNYQDSDTSGQAPDVLDQEPGAHAQTSCLRGIRNSPLRAMVWQPVG